MNDIIIQPDIVLVFTPDSKLKQLKTECDKVQDIFLNHGGTPHVRFGLKLDFLKTIQQNRAQTTMIFHYGGHASADGIEQEVETDGETTRQTLLYSELADYLENSFPNLKMVFINGCNSENAVNSFLKKADVLICTNRPIGDTEACDFAQYFYDNFLKVNYLDLAFSSTQKYLAFGKTRGTGDFQLPRGAMSTSLLMQETPSVFELKYRDNNAEIGKSTFQTWKQIIQPNLTQTKETAATTKTIGVPAYAYLRCNRENQVYDFEDGLTKKTDTQTARPLFVFIHGLEDHCPLDLAERFVNYTLLGEKWQLNKTPVEIELPQNPELRDLDKCQLKLLENYCQKQNLDNKMPIERGRWFNKCLIMN